jgi:hypothetical protein
VAGIGALGIGAFGGLGALVPGDLTAADTATSGGAEGQPLSEQESALAPDWLQNRCESPIVSPSDVPDVGLTLTVTFPEQASIGAQSITGSVQLTNTSEEAVTGTVSAAPAITLSQSGIAVWHTSGVSSLDGVELALQAGESRQFEAVFRPLSCSIEDEARAVDGFDDSLEPVAPGDYSVSAILDVTLDGATSGRTPVVSPLRPVSLELEGR